MREEVESCGVPGRKYACAPITSPSSLSAVALVCREISQCLFPVSFLVQPCDQPERRRGRLSCSWKRNSSSSGRCNRSESGPVRRAVKFKLPVHGASYDVQELRPLLVRSNLAYLTAATATTCTLHTCSSHVPSPLYMYPSQSGSSYHRRHNLLSSPARAMTLMAALSRSITLDAGNVGP